MGDEESIPNIFKSEMIGFTFIVVAVILIIYLMAVGAKESFYGRWRANRCVCTNVMCHCADDPAGMLNGGSVHSRLDHV